MLSTTLFSKGGMRLAKSSRPVMLPYRSIFTRIARGVFLSVPLALGLVAEERAVEVTVFDMFKEGVENRLEGSPIFLCVPFQLMPSFLNSRGGSTVTFSRSNFGSKTCHHS